MLFLRKNLPSLDCEKNVRTLLTVQICLRKLGETAMVPIDILPENVYKWHQVIDEIVSIRRMQSILHRCLKNDPIYQNEIRIKHLTFNTRKFFNLKLLESKAISKNLTMVQAYFCLNNNNHQYLKDQNCNQHIDLTIKFEEKIICNNLMEESTTELENDPDAEIMVIKLEPDSP